MTIHRLRYTDILDTGEWFAIRFYGEIESIWEGDMATVKLTQVYMPNGKTRKLRPFRDESVVAVWVSVPLTDLEIYPHVVENDPTMYDRTLWDLIEG